MSANNLEELFIDATESYTEVQLNLLLKELKKQESLQTNTTVESIDFLLESWDGHVNPPPRRISDRPWPHWTPKTPPPSAKYYPKP